MVQRTSSYSPAVESLRGFIQQVGNTLSGSTKRGWQCQNCHRTVTPALEIDQYPLPHPEDLVAALLLGTIFLNFMNLSAAYQQMILDEDSHPYMPINTQKAYLSISIYQLEWPPSQLFFSKLWTSHDICYLYNILIMGPTHEEHLPNLVEVLTRLFNHGLRLKQEKCSFMQGSIKYLGHHIKSTGVHTATSKVKVISWAPTSS